MITYDLKDIVLTIYGTKNRETIIFIDKQIQKRFNKGSKGGADSLVC